VQPLARRPVQVTRAGRLFLSRQGVSSVILRRTAARALLGVSVALACVLPASSQVGGALEREGGAVDSVDAPRPITEEQRRELERIGTLGYTVGGAPAPRARGLKIWEDEACDGYTVYVSADYSGAFMADMDGHIVHRWHERRPEHWTRAWVYPDGSILGVSAYPARLIKLDSESNVLWEYGTEALRAHHDVVVAPDGRIYALMREARVMEWLRPVPLLDDQVCILEPDGDSVREVACISIPAAFYDSDYANWVASHRFGRFTSDPFHTNSVEVLDGTVPHPAFREGNLLVSVRNMSCLAVIDPDSSKVVWANRGRWLRQHEARVTPGGHVMLFDNRTSDGQSRVVEYDVVDDEIVWEYTEPGFFSRGSGAQQLLPNGNVLITESGKGRVFEITGDGRVVWEFLNPRMLARQGTIVRITRAFRLSRGYFEGEFAEYLEQGGDTRYRRRASSNR